MTAQISPDRLNAFRTSLEKCRRGNEARSLQALHAPRGPDSDEKETCGAPRLQDLRETARRPRQGDERRRKRGEEWEGRGKLRRTSDLVRRLMPGRAAFRKKFQDLGSSARQAPVIRSGTTGCRQVQLSRAVRSMDTRSSFHVRSLSP